MASPNLSAGTTILANVASLAASGTSSGTTSFTAGDLEYRPQLKATFGTVAATAGLTVNVYQIINSVTDTIVFYTCQMPATGSSTQEMSWVLPAGNYSITVTNTDASNAVTNVSIIMDKIVQ